MERASLAQGLDGPLYTLRLCSFSVFLTHPSNLLAFLSDSSSSSIAVFLRNSARILL
jgi:hypothetical protein